MQPPVALPLAELVPPPELFSEQITAQCPRLILALGPQ